MREILYIESIAWRLEDNVGLGGWSNTRKSRKDLPPQQHPAGDNQSGQADYQEPDDDMAALKKPDWFNLYEYNWPQQQERDETHRINLDREQNYWAERDYYDYMEQEREAEREWERSDYPFHDFNYGP